jgi:hypothetical protein
MVRDSNATWPVLKDLAERELRTRSSPDFRDTADWRDFDFTGVLMMWFLVTMLMALALVWVVRAVDGLSAVDRSAHVGVRRSVVSAVLRAILVPSAPVVGAGEGERSPSGGSAPTAELAFDCRVDTPLWLQSDSEKRLSRFLTQLVLTWVAPGSCSVLALSAGPRRSHPGWIGG